MIHIVHAYLNGVLVGHILFFLWTFRYVYFMRQKPVTLANAVYGKRRTYIGQFAGAYPQYKYCMLDFLVSMDLSTAKRVVAPNGLLGYGEEVRVSGVIEGNQMIKVRYISTTQKSVVAAYLAKRFTAAHIISFILSTIGEVLVYERILPLWHLALP